MNSSKRSRGSKKAITAPSEKLLDENKKMEWQLHKLRSQIERERAKGHDERAASGGSIWESGTRVKGSLRGFGKQVREWKERTPVSESILSGYGHTQRMQQQPAQQQQPTKKRVLRGSEARCWSTEDVQCWLGSVELKALKLAFLENEIDGEVLLEIGVDDLDYMGINALGPRKNVLKQVARLKRCVEQVSQRRGTNASEGSQYSQVQVPQAQAQTEIQPQNQAHDFPHAASPSTNVQFGSIANMEINEKAEQEAFRCAVDEWRNSNCTSSLITESKGAGESSCGDATRTVVSCSSSSAGFNDDNLKQGSLDKEVEHKTFVAAVKHWRQQSNPCSNIKVLNFDSYREQAKAKKHEETKRMLTEFEEGLRVKSAWSSSAPKPEHDSKEEKTARDYSGNDDEEADIVLQSARKNEQPRHSPAFDIKAWNFDSVF